MIWKRTVFACFILAAVANVTADDGDQHFAYEKYGATDMSSPIVVKGTVEFVQPPYGLVLSDGTQVEFDSSADWAGGENPLDLRPGDEVVVAGWRDAGAPGLSLKAGGVRVVSRGGRQVPIGSPVCLPPRGTKARGTDLGARRGTAVSSRTIYADSLSKDDEELEGIVVSIAIGGFELETAASARYTVIVVAETEFQGVPGLYGLLPGDSVRVRGDFAGEVLTATRVELRERGGGDNDGGDDDGGGGDSGGEGGVDFESVGVLVELQPPNRLLLSDQRSYVVDGMTIFDDPIVSYAGLAVGQYLEVKAVYEGGGVYRAVKIEYEGDRDEGQGYVRVEGIVDSVSTSSLSLTDGTVVLLRATTVFDGDADLRDQIRPGWHAEIYALRNVAGALVARSVRCEDLELATTVGQEFAPHEAVIALGGGADPEAVAARHEATVSARISSRFVLFTWEREVDDDLLVQLEADRDIEAVEPNFLFRDPESVRRRFVIVDRSPTGAEYLGQAAALRHRFAKALSIADGSGAVVAVIDTGVDRCHPLLAGHLLGGGLDLVDGDISPWESRGGLDEDGDGEIDEAIGHGTFVASLVALAAPGSKILPYRVLDDDGGGTAFNLALALADAIARGVDVINLSLAYRERSMVVDLLLEEAEGRGIVVVAAAGNDGATAMPFPAIDSHVLAVTALRPDGTSLADFANRGDKAVAAAVGEDVYGGLFGGEYGTSSGTSLAAPFAAAGAALVKGLDRGVSAEIVRLLLIQSGVPVSDGTWTGRSLDLGQAVVSIAP